MSEPSFQCDTLVIGAGVVGLALARAFALRGDSTLVLEAEPFIGGHQSSRNSEVIHAGIYYPPGSLKARLCVRGRELLYAYCRARGVEARRLGKLIVASEEAELPQLHALKERAEQNGVRDLSLLSAREARTLEPEVKAVGALFSPSTGILDTHAFMLSLKHEAEEHGALVRLGTRVTGAQRHAAGFAAQYEGREQGQLVCARLINCAGVFAPALARRLEGLDPSALPDAYYAKGHYFYLRGPSPFSRLVYPLPSAHGLGVHVTLDLQGRARFGPDVGFVPALDYAFDETRAGDFARAIQRYYPALTVDRLEPGYAGVRAKLGPEGSSARDFVIHGPAEHGVAGLVNLFGIESPGLTASLAIAEYVVALLASPGGFR